jgi:hypothetical protein
MSNVKAQSSNEAKNLNVKKILELSNLHLFDIWILKFRIGMLLILAIPIN